MEMVLKPPASKKASFHVSPWMIFTYIFHCFKNCLIFLERKNPYNIKLAMLIYSHLKNISLPVNQGLTARHLSRRGIDVKPWLRIPVSDEVAELRVGTHVLVCRHHTADEAPLSGVIHRRDGYGRRGDELGIVVIFVLDGDHYFSDGLEGWDAIVWDLNLCKKAKKTEKENGSLIKIHELQLSLDYKEGPFMHVVFVFNRARWMSFFES